MLLPFFSCICSLIPSQDNVGNLSYAQRDPKGTGKDCVRTWGNPSSISWGEFSPLLAWLSCWLMKSLAWIEPLFETNFWLHLGFLEASCLILITVELRPSLSWLFVIYMNIDLRMQCRRRLWGRWDLTPPENRGSFFASPTIPPAGKRRGGNLAGVWPGHAPPAPTGVEAFIIGISGQQPRHSAHATRREMR